MSVFVFVLVPALVVPLVLLLGLSGCSSVPAVKQQAKLPDTVTSYADAIKKPTNNGATLLGYWRLYEGNDGSRPSTAKDETGATNGAYTPDPATAGASAPSLATVLGPTKDSYVPQPAMPGGKVDKSNPYKAPHFDGHGYVEIPGKLALNPLSPCVEFWVSCENSTMTLQVIFSALSSSGAPSGYGVGRVDNTLALGIVSPGGIQAGAANNQRDQVKGTLVANDFADLSAGWKHVVMFWNQDDPTGVRPNQVTLYINGARQQLAYDPRTADKNGDNKPDPGGYAQNMSGNALRIGAEPGDGTKAVAAGFVGSIAEVAIWSGPLSEVDINLHIAAATK